MDTPCCFVYYTEDYQMSQKDVKTFSPVKSSAADITLATELTTAAPVLKWLFHSTNNTPVDRIMPHTNNCITWDPRTTIHFHPRDSLEDLLLVRSAPFSFKPTVDGMVITMIFSTVDLKQFCVSVVNRHRMSCMQLFIEGTVRCQRWAMAFGTAVVAHKIRVKQMPHSVKVLLYIYTELYG